MTPMQSPYLTPQERRRRQAAEERRLPATPTERAEAMDRITDLYPAANTMPARAAASHQRLARELNEKAP